MPNSKLIIGILGAPGSGKSTIAAQFQALGCKIIDADKIAHELLQTDTVKKKVQNEFGSEVFNSQGQIERQKLSTQVFKNIDKLNLSLRFLRLVNSQCIF